MNRVQKITVRLNDIESEIVRENADKEHITVSEYIRSLIKTTNDMRNITTQYKGQVSLTNIM